MEADKRVNRTKPHHSAPRFTAQWKRGINVIFMWHNFFFLILVISILTEVYRFHNVKVKRGWVLLLSVAWLMVLNLVEKVNPRKICERLGNQIWNLLQCEWRKKKNKKRLVEVSCHRMQCSVEKEMKQSMVDGNRKAEIAECRGETRGGEVLPLTAKPCKMWRTEARGLQQRSAQTRSIPQTWEDNRAWVMSEPWFINGRLLETGRTLARLR